MAEIDAKTLAKIKAALDAADAMYAEFMEPTRSLHDQVPLYKAAHAKVKAARKAIES